MTEDRLWSVDEVARFLGVSRATVYTLAIRFSKIGKSRRYDQADVRQFVAFNESRAALPSKKPAKAVAVGGGE